MMLWLYMIYHLNLCFSSIEENQRPEVVRRCYWPLLHLAGDLGVPIGVEASGYTLETIASLDPAWIDELKELVRIGLVEFIGSGYAQIIGPLVPAEVNAANLRLGHEVYERLLGFRPKIALVNEQAYAAGLVQHYLDAGYRAMIMDWDNPAHYHPDWEPKWRYLPQFACGQHGEKIPLIWNNSMVFQKFQHYAHGDMELNEYLAYLNNHVAETQRTFPLYGNDVEVFDFRPGRYNTESALQEDGEWLRIRLLFEPLIKDGRFRFVCPGQVLNLIDKPGAGNLLHLESSEQPVPVKKQGKYNVTRWAVTGRDDLGINTACWQIHEALEANPATTDDEWRELCYLWSSDFRTHITDLRWKQYCERLNAFQDKVGGQIPFVKKEYPKFRKCLTALAGNAPKITRNGRFLTVETGAVRVRLNCQRGLAIDGLWLGHLEGPSLCGSLPHGYYDDISLGSDWYSGHTILENLGQPKVTDLNPVEPIEEILYETGDVVIQGVVSTYLGNIIKRVKISSAYPLLALSYILEWESIPVGAFRLGNITLNPDGFDRSTLWYRTCNGGKRVETFPLAGTTIEHGNAVSFLVSAGCGIGITCGWVEIGDAKHKLCVEVDKAAAALIGLMNYKELGDTYFCRLALSAGELDDTRCLTNTKSKAKRIECKLCLKLSH